MRPVGEKPSGRVVWPEEGPSRAVRDVRAAGAEKARAGGGGGEPAEQSYASHLSGRGRWARPLLETDAVIAIVLGHIGQDHVVAGLQAFEDL
jgi:hypothetical protein